MTRYLNAGAYLIGMEETHYRTGKKYYTILLEEFGSFDTREEAADAITNWKRTGEDSSDPKTFQIFQITSV